MTRGPRPKRRQSTVSMFQGKEMDNKKEFRIIFGLEFVLE